MTELLDWGLRHAVPKHAPVAWGARAIIHDGGQTFELLGDRQQMVGAPALRKALGRAMNGADGKQDGYLARAQAEYRELSLFGGLRWSSEGEVQLVHDHHVCIQADPRGSFGYLYVAAWFDADDIDTSAAVLHGQDGYADDATPLKWSHAAAPPAIGEDRDFGVRVGRATVVGYRETHGFLMALVVPYEAFCNPERLPVVAVYGCDIVEPESEASR